MSKPYTPTTEHVRDLALRLMNADEFNRWLNEVKAQAWEEGAMQGHDDHEFGVEVWTNPYRKGN